MVISNGRNKRIVEKTLVSNSDNLAFFSLMPYSRFAVLSKFLNLSAIQLLNLQAGVSQLEMILPPPLPSGGIWQCLETFLIVMIWGMSLAFSGQKPALLLSILQYTDQLPATKNYPSKISVVPILRNAGLHNLYM